MFFELIEDLFYKVNMTFFIYKNLIIIEIDDNKYIKFFNLYFVNIALKIANALANLNSIIWYL